MYPRTAAFDAACRNGGTVVTTIDVYRAGVKVAADIPWAQPSTVTVDETASTWRTCEVTVADMNRNLIPKTPQAALAPYGTDLFIRTGFRFPNGTVEQKPMGVFRILMARPTRKGLISLLGYDYSRVVARARFETLKAFPRGYSRAQAIADLIAERIASAGPPGHEVLNSSVADDSTLPLTVFEEGERYGDPWKACMDMADAAGQQVFFLPSGPFPTAILRPAPDLLTSSVVWSFDESTSSTKIDMRPEMDATPGYNVYVVTGESSELASTGVVPVRGSAEVTDPNSPIYPATYGRVPTFLASTFIKTNAQAQAVADANLPLKAGGSEKLAIVGFAHPAMEGGDVVYAKDTVLGIDSDWIVSRFSIDLSLQDPTTYSCRAKRVA
jgi:hypothetical protein